MLFNVEHLRYRYENTVAIDGLTLSIPERCRAAILGANGSGKSTLLRLLDGLCFGESGVVRFLGAELNERSFASDEFAFGFRRRVGMVFQNSDVQLFNPTVFDEVAFSPLQLRLSREDVRSRVMETLEWLRIAHLKDRNPHHLSGGEKKRVALASVLVMDPEVLLLDEPTAGLDPRSQSQIIELLVEWGGGPKTVITATNDLGDLRDISDRCYILDGGRLVAEGRPDEILRDTELLRRTNLIHEHRHRHGAASAHSHPRRNAG